MFPLIEPTLKRRILHRILPTLLSDNVKVREMRADGSYRRVLRKPDTPPLRAQHRFLADSQSSEFENEVVD
jgi:polyphosphate kinase